MKSVLVRWKYRLIYWFLDNPDAFRRRVEVENALIGYARSKHHIPPEVAFEMAMKLGIRGK